MKKIVKVTVFTMLMSVIALPLSFAEKSEWAGNKIEGLF